MSVGMLPLRSYQSRCVEAATPENLLTTNSGKKELLDDMHKSRR